MNYWISFYFFSLQFEFIQLPYKIHCTRYKNDKKLDDVFAVLHISYCGESYKFFVITSSFNKCVQNTVDIINMEMQKQLILCSNVVSAQEDIYLPSVLLLIPVVKEQK